MSDVLWVVVLSALFMAGGLLAWLRARRASVARTSEQTKASRGAPPQVERPVWIPITQEGDGGPRDSKFGGVPWLSEDEQWPLCPECQQPRELLLQLDLATLPHRPQGCPSEGLLQLFYCTNGDDECEFQMAGWDAFSENTLLRMVMPSNSRKALASSPANDPLPPRRIVGWEQRTDYPASQEADELGIKLPETKDKDRTAEPSDMPIQGDKLMGWPRWVQEVEYPECPICERRMSYLFQIDSEDNLPIMFGDMGTGHITFCPEHPDQLAFGWACH